MKQIKTIMVKMRDVDDLAEFDEKVNAAMAEGWALAKREALQAQSVGIVCVLYAELEREIVKEEEEEERNCETCAHFSKNLRSSPCCNCEDVNEVPTLWEPKR